MTTVPDSIEKRILLKAPLTRVWQAISDARQFGRWFGVAFDGPFRPGAKLTGHIVPTEVDPEVAKLQEPHRGAAFEVEVETVEPERLFSFRWHPFAIEKGVDYSREPSTRVVFTLTPTPEGTLFTVTESGFSGIPLHRRAAAFAANDGGWSHQVKLVERYLALHG